MAIEGPLRELSLTDVIQLLHLSRKTGTLAITAEGASRPGLIHFDQGSVVGARPAGESSPLGRLLVMAGKATLGQVEAALEQQRRKPAVRIGALLVEEQGIAATEVKRQLRFQVEETVFDLVRWRDGYFRFEETPPLDAGSIGIRVPSESLLMESMRRADEWMEMASGEADASLVPVLVERDLDPSGVLSLNPAEWQVLAAVDGAHTLREIAREIGRGEFDVAKAVFSLASDGVIELRTRPSSPAGPRQAQRSLEEEVALVESELRAGRSAAALRRIEALTVAHPATGAISLLRGRALSREGRSEEALEAFQAAVREDPLLGDGYFHLGLALAGAGELRRARESLATYARLPEAAGARLETATRAMQLLAELGSILEEER